MLKLYCFGESGNAYKAALTLELSRLEWTPVFVDFFGGESRSDAFRAINPMGEVPVLVDTEHDYTLTQSGAIQDYVVHLSGKLTGATPEERRDVLRWVLWDNHKLSSQAGMLRFLMNFLPEDKRPAEVITFTQARLKAAYQVLNAHLEGRDWIVGDALTVADISCCGYLFYPEPFGFDRAEWPHIDAWLARIEGTPGWKHPYDLMPRSAADSQ
ncbi:MAG: glutathione S-transferase family protein [Pseudomonadota bacterium]